MLCNAGPICKIHERLLQEGYAVTQYALRQWVKDGKIPSVRSGTKIFITYSNVLEFLTTGQVTSTAIKPAN